MRSQKVSGSKQPGFLSYSSVCSASTGLGSGQRGFGLPPGLQGRICFIAFLPMFCGLCSRALPAFVSALSSTSDPLSPFHKDPHADRSHLLIQDHLPILGSLITSPWPREVTGCREQHMGVVRQPYSASHRLACTWCLTPHCLQLPCTPWMPTHACTRIAG